MKAYASHRCAGSSCTTAFHAQHVLFTLIPITTLEAGAMIIPILKRGKLWHENFTWRQFLGRMVCREINQMQYAEGFEIS